MLFKKRKPASPSQPDIDKEMASETDFTGEAHIPSQANDSIPTPPHPESDELDIPILDDVVVDGEPPEAPNPEEAESNTLSPQAELEDLVDELVERTMDMMRDQLKDELMDAVKKRYPHLYN